MAKLLAADASFRRYERLSRDTETAVLMDAPPPHENVAAFNRVARQLLDLGLSAPRPVAVDEAAGLMLLEDLGDQTFTRALAEGTDEARLYPLAVDVLIALHQAWRPKPEAALPAYDDSRLLNEAALLPDWTLPALRGAEIAADARESYIEAWRAVLPRARAVTDCLVLRDYHVDNLMLLDNRDSIAACGLLDFQDALSGPAAYDLTSFLADGRRDISPQLKEAMLDRYFAAFEAGTLKPEVLNDKIEEFSLRLQQLEEEKSNLEGDIEGMSLEEIDQAGIKTYVDALEAVLENGGNEQKKHLLRTLVEKVLVHDKDKYEFTFRLPDGSTLQHALETIPEGEANPLSVNHLAPTVCNHDTAAPRIQRT